MNLSLDVGQGERRSLEISDLDLFGWGSAGPLPASRMCDILFQVGQFVSDRARTRPPTACSRAVHASSCSALLPSLPPPDPSYKKLLMSLCGNIPSNCARTSSLQKVQTFVTKLIRRLFNLFISPLIVNRLLCPRFRMSKTSHILISRVAVAQYINKDIKQQDSMYSITSQTPNTPESGT